MAQLIPIAEADLLAAVNGPSDLDPTQHAQVIALSFVRVRVLLADDASGAVAVRPWYWRDGKWWPLRADGAGAGTAPVTADPAVHGGRAEGYYAALGLSNPVAMAAESGDDDDAASAVVYIEPCDANSS